jgi:hypothetical protein
VGATARTARRLALAAAGVALVAATARADRVDVGALPIVNYNSDFGLGGGVNGALYLRAPGYLPFRYAITAQAFATTGGAQRHFLKLDAPRFLGGALRPTLQLAFARDAPYPYYGIGNTIELPADDDPGRARGDLEVTLTAPSITLVVKRDLGAGFSVSVGHSVERFTIDAAPTSRLARERPAGANGGLESEAHVEVAFDARDVEASPTRGVYLSLAARGGHPALGSSWRYGGAMAVARGYLAPFGTPRLVVAARVGVDLLAGRPPFFTLPGFPGTARISGLGGSDSVRGLPRNLHIGKLKAVGNLELRSLVRGFRPGRHALDLWLAGFADVGRVWRGLARDGDALAVDASLGGGVRIAWERDYVVRADLAFASAGTSAFYLGFDQLF